MEFKAYTTRRKNYAAWRSTLDGKEWVQMLRKKQHDLCFICLFPLEEKVHIDHLKALYDGGTNAEKNLCLTHPRCNIQKGVAEILKKEEIKYRKDLLYKIGIGVRNYNLPRPHSEKQIDAIIFASEYIDLTKFLLSKIV